MLLTVRLSTSGAAWFFMNEQNQNVGGILKHITPDSEMVARRMVELWNADQNKGDEDE